jgi:hypothetical protein
MSSRCDCGKDHSRPDPMEVRLLLWMLLDIIRWFGSPWMS